MSIDYVLIKELQDALECLICYTYVEQIKQVMITTKVFLRKDNHPKTGLYPLVLRITKNRNSVFITTKIKVHEAHWNPVKSKLRNTYPLSTRGNKLLEKLINKANEIAFTYEIEEVIYTARDVKNKMLQKDDRDLLVYARDFILRDKSVNKINYATYKKYSAIINKISNCVNGSLRIEDFNYSFLKTFESYLINTCHNKTNTVSTNFSFLRKLANQLIIDDAMDVNSNPFKKWEFKYEETKRKHLSEEDLEKIEKLFIKGEKIRMSRDIFLFCARTGLRIGDALLLKKENFTSTHLIFESQKTGYFSQILCLPFIVEMIGNYTEDKADEEYIFDFLTEAGQSEEESALKEHKSKTSLINKNLKLIAERCKISENISTHYGRHSFANNALIKGCSIEEIKAVLGHADIKTTQLYARSFHQLSDDAMKKLG